MFCSPKGFKKQSEAKCEMKTMETLLSKPVLCLLIPQLFSGTRHAPMPSFDPDHHHVLYLLEKKNVCLLIVSHVKTNVIKTCIVLLMVYCNYSSGT